jgi:hypothetical protein
LGDANESENEKELITMEGISPNSFFLPQASTNIAEQISRITCNYCPLFWIPFFGNQSVWIHLFVYSDGIEVSVGEIRDTIKARLYLEKGEHIVGVTPIFDEVDRIGFRLSTGLYLFAETISYGPFRTVGQTVNASPDFHSSEDELSVGSGNALRSIEWDDGNLKIEHLSTVPLTSIDDTPGNINADMIPTLASLARQTYESFFDLKLKRLKRIVK